MKIESCVEIAGPIPEGSPSGCEVWRVVRAGGWIFWFCLVGETIIIDDDDLDVDEYYLFNNENAHF